MFHDCEKPVPNVLKPPKKLSASHLLPKSSLSFIVPFFWKRKAPSSLPCTIALTCSAEFTPHTSTDQVANHTSSVPLMDPTN